MQTFPCYAYTEPAEKAAWLSLVAAETALEAEIVRAYPLRTIAMTGLAGYFLLDGQLWSTPADMENEHYSVDLEEISNRMDYEDLSVEDMGAIEKQIRDWLALPFEERPYMLPLDISL